MEIGNGIVHRHDVETDKEYVSWIREIKQRYKYAQIKAAIKVNSEQLYFNWRLGRDLVLLRAEEKWGKGVVEQIALDLQAEFPNSRGFSTRNLWFMKQWYLFYSYHSYSAQPPECIHEEKLKQLDSVFASQTQKLKQLDSEIRFPPDFGSVPWMHHVLIIQKCKSVDEALFYIKKTIAENLSRNQLGNYIRSDLYHTSGDAMTNFKETLPDSQGKLAQDLLRSNYDFGFVQLGDEYDEFALEDALEKQMTKFLLELGQGWAFIGRQKELLIAGKSRRIDLLFYHIRLRCYVVLELKAKPFEPEYAGKLNFYVNAVDAYLRQSGDNPTIGLLVCKDMDKSEVHLSFQGIMTPMGVATYKNVKVKEIESHLPTAKELQYQVDIAEEEYKSRRKRVQGGEGNGE